ncbi:amidohydrolase family protein, partial [Eubacteriales bacterium DFI.9.88]|nr:amidohydrolase family protein [Eubacteriales bacterium DFI.9.88]
SSASSRSMASAAFTINGANTMGIEDMTGSLEVGKHADLVVMEQNLFDTDAADFYRTEVYMTISEGEIIYKKRE